MLLTWALNVAGLFLTTVGALLIFLYLWKSPRCADEWLSPSGKQAYAKHRRLLTAGAGLMAVWFVIQYVAAIFL